jgi:hypothetical protein
VVTTHDAGATPGDTAVMKGDARRILTLAIDPGSDPISGRLDDEQGSGEGEEFVGWLGLAKALESVLGLAPRLDSADPPGS